MLPKARIELRLLVSVFALLIFPSFFLTISLQAQDFSRVKTKFDFHTERTNELDSIFREDKRKALKYIERLVPIIKEEKDYQTLVYFLEREAYILRSHNDSLAISTIDEAIRISKEHLPSNDLLLSKAYFRRGAIKHRKSNFYESAANFDSAQVVYSHASEYDSALYKDIISYKYYAYDYGQINIDTLTKYLGERIKIVEATGGSINDRMLLYNTYPSLYLQKGDFTQALASSMEEVGYAEANLDSIKINRHIGAYYNLGTVLYKMNDYNRGLRVCNTLLDKYKKLKPVNDTIGLEYMYGLRAAMLVGLKKYDEAIEAFKFLVYDYNSPDPDRSQSIIRYKMNLARCYGEVGDFSVAKNYLNEALGSARALFSFPNKEFEIFYRVAGYLYRKNEDFNLSFEYYDSAVRNGIPNYYSGKALDFPRLETEMLPYEALEGLLDKTIAFNDLYKFTKTDSLNLLVSAENYALETHQILMQSREQLIQSEGKLFLSEDFKPLYEAGIEACYYLYKNKVEEDRVLKVASAFFGLSKALLFLEQSGEFSEIQNPAVPTSLKAEFYNLKNEVENLSRSVYDILDDFSSSDKSINSINASLTYSNNRLSRLKDSISQIVSDDPEQEYFSKEADFNNYTKVDIKNNQALIEYFVGDKQIFVLAQARGKSVFERIPVDSIFFSSLENTINEVNHRPEFSNYNYQSQLDFFIANSNQLYELLLDPVLEQIGGNIEELTIIPDDYLSKLPFEILLTELPGKSNSFKTLPYLIKNYTINYELSSRKKNPRFLQRRANNNLLGIGYSQGVDGMNGVQMANLPGTEREIKFLQSKVEGDYYLGSDGSKERFLQVAKNYDVLHLAIHGIADTTGRYDSRLIFNGTNNILKTSDLYLADIQARLAILSACESGVGEINKGEGTFSIARGFALVGVPSIVMSLWNVDDKTTSDLMVKTHVYLNEEHKPINEALGLTKLDYLQNSDNYTSHPYYWAAFISLGSPIQIGSSYDVSNYIAIALSVALLIAVGIWVARKKRKRAV